MIGNACQKLVSRAGLLLVLGALVVFQAPGSAQQSVRHSDEQMLTYLKGQSVTPIYHGWQQNPDGSYRLYFSYLNRNWEEEVDIPIGANNNVTAPYGPDAGQPTHFYPRQNRWVFTLNVPKDFGDKEVVWTLTAHGQTNRAYATLKPGYAVSEFLIQHEFGAANDIEGKPDVVLKVEGEKTRNVKVGESVELAAVGTDPFVPPQRRRGGAGGGRARGPQNPAEMPAGQLGGDFVRATAGGLWFAWMVYRGPSMPVAFDPKVPFKVWEDERGGSPWGPGFQAPPVPPGNRWIYHVTFKQPGTYVLRGYLSSGNKFAVENITFNVT